MHYLLFYETADDYATRRAAHRNEHLEKAWQSSERGELVLGGALGNPMDGAVLLFKGTSPAVAENFAKADPYVTSGMVKRWYVREWATVAGEDASSPIRPDQEGSQSAMSEDRGLMLRMWRARASAENVDGYIQHATKNVFPSLRTIEGHRGGYLLRRTVGGVIELVVLTLWGSMDAIRNFAGAEPAKAVVEPEARATLTDFDNFVTHYDVVHSTVEGREK